jgi:hypothetical protein
MSADDKTLLKIYIAVIFLNDFDDYFEKDVDVEIYEKYNLSEVNNIQYKTSILLMDKLIKEIKPE